MISDDPPVWGWWLVDRRRRMPHRSVRVFQKLEMNFGSQSETIASESPWCQNICQKKMWAGSSALSVPLQAQKWTRFESLSTKVSTASKPSVLIGRWVIESVVISLHRCLGSASGWGAPSGFVCPSFCCWQIIHPLQYERPSLYSFFQWNGSTRARVFANEKCPDMVVSWAKCRISILYFFGTHSFFP